MNATWVGTFVSGKDRKQQVVVFHDSDWLSIRLLIAEVCKEQMEDGWYLESYEMTGEDDGRATQAH